jgi:hypothetical protein
MAARRGLALLGSVISLLVAAAGAAWLWVAMATGQPLLHELIAGAAVLLALAGAARCVGHLLATLPRAAAVDWAELHDAADTRLPRLRDDSAAAPRGPRDAACPWCHEPLKAGATRCSACGQAL